MKKKYPLFLLAVLASSSALAVSLTVDPDQTVAELEGRSFGINVDYLMDDDDRLPRDISTADALKKMNVGVLRYPGGEKSENYLWSAAPWTSAAPRAARPHAWPTTNSTFFESDQTMAKEDVMDFDEFMVLCLEVGAEPVITVSFDAMYKAASGSEVPPSKATLLENAVEWVRYANITKGYGIKRWTLGNETDYGESYAGSKPGAAQYANDAKDFAQAMKAVDPTIHIGVNGHGKGWFDTILSIAVDDIDFLEVHTYPLYNLGSYNAYRNNNHLTKMTREVKDVAKAAIDSLPNAADRERLYVTLTETGALDFQEPEGWGNVNSVGKALATFEIMMRHLEIEYVKYPLLWNTRWVKNDSHRVISSDPVVPGLEALEATDDPGLENGGTGWSLGNGVNLSSDAYTGSNALETTGGWQFRNLPVERFDANASYNFSYFGKVADTSQWAASGITFYYEGSKVGEAKVNTVSTAYTLYEESFLAPVQFDEVILWVQSQSGGTLTVDDFSVETAAVSAGAEPSVYDALDRAGNLNPTGQAMELIGKFVKDRLVSVAGETDRVRAFVSQRDNGALNIFVINKDQNAQTIDFSFPVGIDYDLTGLWQFSGDSEHATEGELEAFALADVVEPIGTLSVAPVSITVLECLPIQNSSPDVDVVIEAESIDDHNGVAAANGELSNIHNGEWVRYDAFDFGAGVESVEFFASAKFAGGVIDMRIDSETGDSIGTVSVTSTGNFWTYQSFTAAINSSVSGVHNLYLVFSGGSDSLMNIDWFEFTSSAGTNPSTGEDLDVVFEAEAFDEVLQINNQDAVGIYSGGTGQKIGAISNGDWVCYYAFDFGTGADSVDLSMSSDTNGGTVEFRLDSETGPLIGSASVEGTDGWNNFVPVFAELDTIPTDIHDLYFVFTGGGGSLLDTDWFQFNSGDGSSPSVDPTDYQAEDAVLSTGNIVKGPGSGWNGTGFVDMAEGGWIEWTVNVSVAGTYDLDFVGAGGASGMACEVRVNGSVVNPSLPFPNTGSWNSVWQVAPEAGVSLNAGDNVIRITDTGDNQPQVDQLTVR